MLASVASTGYEVILTGMASGLTAQLIKIFTDLIQHKGFNFRLLVQTGGMPSSHSASMTGTAISVGFITGFDSISFAIAISMAMVVMYDAAGVRRAAGRMAEILNKVTDDFYHERPAQFPERLRELLGHTPVEVIAGAILGFLVAYFMHYEIIG